MKEKIESYRAKLLDLSGRNRMLNFKLGKSQGVELSLPDITNALSELVIFGDNDPWFEVVATKDATPSVVQKSANDDSSEEEEEWIEPLEKIYFSSEYKQSNINSRLSQTYRRYREALDDRGVNILGLAAVFLTTPIQAVKTFSKTDSWDIPLLLVRLAMERRKDKRGRIHFVFKTEDEIIVNPAALRFLRDEMTPGVKLPELTITDKDIEEATDEEVKTYRHKALNDWVAKLTEAIPSSSKWKLDASRVAISSSFTFHKFPMYEDLDSKHWEAISGHNILTSNPLIQRLLGLAKDGEGEGSSEVTKGQLEASERTFTVLDADSSQLKAIVEASNGSNLVVHGPPGTGKSQTITNLITQLVAENKKVLFVSEKRAALEVVAKNFNRVGLKHAYIDLHGNQIQAKEFKEKLQQSWESGKLATTSVENFSENLSALKRTRDILDRYSHAVNTPIGNQEITFNYALGRILSLEERIASVASSIKIPSIQEWSKEDYNERIDFLTGLTPLLERVKGFEDNQLFQFWEGLTLSVVSPLRTEELLTISLEKLRQLRETFYWETKVLISPATLDRFVRACAEIKLEFLEGISLHNNNIKEILNNKDRLLGDLQSIQENQEQLNRVFNKSSIDGEDLRGLKEELLLNGAGWPSKAPLLLSKLLRPQYYESVAKYNKLHNSSVSPTGNHSERIHSLDKLIKFKKDIQLFETKYTQIFGKLLGDKWLGYKSSGALLQGILENLEALNTIAEENSININDCFYELSEVKKLSSDSTSSINNFKESLKEFFKQIVPEEDQAERFTSEMLKLDFSLIQQVMTKIQLEIPKLEDLLLLKRKEGQAKEYSLEPLFEKLLSEPSIVNDLSSVLCYLWHNQFCNIAREKYPIIDQQLGSELDNLRNVFQQYDLKYLKDNQKRVELTHNKEIRNFVLSSATNRSAKFIKELFHLSRFKASRRPRAVLANHLSAVQNLFPVFMMSPLAVSQYLPKEICFDVIIFDEASQVLPEDAFGAIARGKQLIVVGDQKQLPPSSFFNTLSDYDEEDAEEDVLDSVESLIDLSLTSNFREVLLQWHYRSQHESLIRLSNREFYNDSLIYAPSPDKPASKGLSFVKTKGSYQRGGGMGGVNPGEAAEIAIAVYSFFKEASTTKHEKSLGIISFSRAQQDVIREELKKLSEKMGEQDFMSFIDENKDSSERTSSDFFVKNLESVQGDERDVIFVSVCYGKTDEGRIYQSFGPVNQKGGERRLNVMMTRARQQCVAFANFSGDELATTENTARGVVILKEFLRYAESGEISFEELGEQDFGSPFEESVANVIALLGYNFQSQVGVMGFRIDLAIRDPKRLGRFTLGIECDGATYHSSKIARDRDRLREELLRKRGWNIYRIWSTDWRRDRKGETARLKSAIESSITNT